MIRIVIVASVLALSVKAAVPQNLDVIKMRQQTMKDADAAAGADIKILKHQAPFDLAVVQNSLKTISSAAKKMPTLFPDDSKTGGDTRAMAEMWANKPDVIARYAKLDQDAAAALVTIKDEASFAATFPHVFKNCGACHELYRATD
jgi:cytochrome c556